jgi:hypothetical protein
MYSKTTGHNEAVMSKFLKIATTLQHITFIPTCIRVKNYAVAQLVEALRYKPEGCGFDIHGVIGIFP